MKSTRLRTALVLMVAITAFGISLPNAFAHVLVFGPKTYTIAAGRQQTATDTFALPDGCRDHAVYTITVTNGRTDGSSRVSSGRVNINGVAVINPSDFNQNAGSIERDVTLDASNTLSVDLTGGHADGLITISISRHIDVHETLFAKSYTLTSNKASDDQPFAASGLSDRFSVIARSGSTSGANVIKSAVVTLNGANVITVSDWQPHATIVEKDIVLAANNQFHIEINGSSGDGLSVEIVRHVTDAAGPSVTTTPASGAFVTASSLSLTGQVQDVSGVMSLSIRGAAVPVAGDGTFSTTVALVPGENHIAVVAKDCEGNTTSQDLLVTYNAQPPQVTITTPAADAILLARTVTVSGTVSSQIGIQSVTVNGQPAALSGTTYTAALTLPADSMNSLEGLRQITVVATDLAARQTTATRSVTVDLNPPTIVASAPTGWVNSAVTVTFLCVDVGSGIATCPDPVSITTEGANQPVTGTATDRAGRSATATAQVSIDLTLPVLTVDPVSATPTNTATLRVSGHVSDALSGLRGMTCNGLPATATGADFLCDVALLVGSNTIEIRAEDAAGNAAVQTATARLDVQPPTLTIDSPADQTITNKGTVIVSGTVSEDDAVASLLVGGVATTPSGGGFTATIPLQEGVNPITVVAADRAGNTSSATVNVTRFSVPSVSITSPKDLAVVNTSTTTITGTVSADATSVNVNGVAATVSGGAFHVDVPLVQGRTIVTAAATSSSGHVSTTNINIYRDGIPPRITVYSPATGATVRNATVNVTGIVDDVVVGTVNAGQVRLDVNGVSATVSNRSFVAPNVPLSPGLNTITLTATDQGGNVATTSTQVTYDSSATSARITATSGNLQQAMISATLPQALTVRLYDSAGLPAAGRLVQFRVIQNNGRLATSNGGTPATVIAVTTNVQGDASAAWTLGTRAGAGNNRVEASATGFGTVEFQAIATPDVPKLVVIDAGGNQYGAAGQPLARPIIVAVVDRGSNRLENVPVTFAIAQGDGSINGRPNVTANTDSDGRAWVTPTLGPDANAFNVFTATVGGVATPAVFSAIGRMAGPAEATQISGVVLDNLDTPIPGVTVRIDGAPVSVQTDAQGQFVIKPAPIGYVRLIADGSTSTRLGTWPTLEFPLYTISGQDNTVGMPMYLLPIDVTRGIQVSEQTGGTLTFPELPGFSLKIAPGTALFPGGTRAGTVSVTLVHSDKMPMTPAFGQQPQFLVTIQPPGVHFDPPAPITFPNTDGLAPGEVTEMYSFDHDLGQFVAIGTASVSADGTVLASDPGVGIIKGGWHASGNPTPTGTCDACAGKSSSTGGCRKADGSKCVPDLAKNNMPCRSSGGCMEATCKDGTCVQTPIDFNIEEANRYVDRDDPTRSWDNAQDLHLGTPLYANDTSGDNVSFKAVTKTLRIGPTSWVWVAKGPQTFNGPNAPEWRIDNIHWKPGFYTIECTVTFGNGCKLTRKYGQYIGVRTDEIFVVGSIQPEDFAPTEGVTAYTLTKFDCAALGGLGGGLALVPLIRNPDAFNDPTSSAYVPPLAADRLFVNYFLIDSTHQVFPSQALDVTRPPEEAYGLDPALNYRLFARVQYKYVVRDGVITTLTPIGPEVSVPGSTPGACNYPIFSVSGVPGPGNRSRAISADGSQVLFLLKVRASQLDADGYQALNNRSLPYVFFRFRFDTSDGHLKSYLTSGPSSNPDADIYGADLKDYSPLPTFFVYRRSYDGTSYQPQLLTSIFQDLKTFLNISPIVGAPHFP